jgi:hypothetical protein
MLLEYALLTVPAPLQAGMPATLTLAISNGGHQPVTVTSIVVTLPIGSNAKDLTGSTGFQTSVTSGWNVAQSGGVLTLTPAGSGAVGGTAIVLTIANVAVNERPGTAEIAIGETAALAGGNATNNSTSLPAAKFPAQFALSNLIVMPPEVPFGGSVSLTWTGTQTDGATYTLTYPGVEPIAVSHAGPYQANNLTVFPAVFTLTASLIERGQDQPVIAQRQATVTETPKLGIRAFTPSKLTLSGADDRLVLSWEVQLATSLELTLAQAAGAVDVGGQSACIVSSSGSPALVVCDPKGKQLGTLTPSDPMPRFLSFVLSAGDGTSTVQSSVQVEVLPPQITEFRTAWELFPDPNGGSFGFPVLYWTTVNAAPVTITPPVTQPGGASGKSVIKAGTIYTIAAAGFGGTVSTKTTIPVEAPRRPAREAARLGSTLLDYALLTAPAPLQAGMPATLTLVISNGGSQPVTVTRIAIALPIGTNAKDLTASTGFQTGTTPGWNLAQNGGVLTLTPAGGGMVGRTAVVVTIAAVSVNAQPGIATVSIDETAALGGGNATNNKAPLPLAKFPVQFALSDLVATPTEVAFGGSSSLMWTGTPNGATYTLQYPGSGPMPVSAAGPYVAANLTIFPAVFTLTVSLTVPGQDQPLVVQKQTTVTEAPKLRIVDFSQSKLVLSSADDRLALRWEVQLATSLTLGLDQVSGAVDVAGQSSCIISASGSPTIVVTDAAGTQLGTLTPTGPFPPSLTFVLTASDGASFVASRAQVTVLPPQITEFFYDYTVWHEEGPHYDWYIHWATVNASPVTLQPFGKVGPSGKYDAYYGATYTISAAGFGATVTAQKTIQR